MMTLFYKFTSEFAFVSEFVCYEPWNKCSNSVQAFFFIF